MFGSSHLRVLAGLFAYPQRRLGGGLIAQDLPSPTQALLRCDTGAKIGTAESWKSRIEAILAQHPDRAETKKRITQWGAMALEQGAQPAAGGSPTSPLPPRLGRQNYLGTS